MQKFTVSIASPNPASTASWPTQLAHRLHFMNYGQSNSIGTSSTPSLTTSQPYDNEMFDTGVRIPQIDDGTGGTISAFTDLVEQDDGGYGETGVAAAANMFVAKMASFAAHPDQGFRVLGTAGGRGGVSIASLWQGTSFYNDMKAAVQAGYDLSVAAGESFAFGAMAWIHGEHDQTLSTLRTAYRDDLRTLNGQVDDDMRSLTGQALRPAFLVAQLASHLFLYDDGSHTSPARPEIALAQRDACQGQANMFMVMPRYIEDYGADNLHADEEGNRLRGKYFGRAWAKIMRARQENVAVPPLVVDLKSAMWQGNTIDLQFSVPHGVLEFDTTWVSACDNMGFDLWSADGGTLLDIIDSVTIEGPDRVRVVCSETPPPGAILSYGFGRPATDTTSGRASGVAGNLRDNEGDVDTYVDGAAATRRLDNYCLIFETAKP